MTIKSIRNSENDFKISRSLKCGDKTRYGSSSKCVYIRIFVKYFRTIIVSNINNLRVRPYLTVHIETKTHTPPQNNNNNKNKQKQKQKTLPHGSENGESRQITFQHIVSAIHFTELWVFIMTLY